MSKPDAKAGVPRKPLIFADDPFDSLDEQLAHIKGNWDASYVEGYSERKRENALRVRDGQEPLPMDRLQWVRISRGSGQNLSETDEAMHNWRALGYRAMGLDDLEERGYKMPPTAHVAADGTIRRGDLALFYTPERRAAANRNDEAKQRSEVKASNLKPTHDGLEITEDTRTVEHKTNPRKVLAGLPQL